MTNYYKYIFAAAFLASGVASQAAVIASWDLTGDTGIQASEAPISAETGVTGMSITRGGGISAGSTATSNSITSVGWEGTAEGAASNEFFSFGFTVENGFSVDLTDLTIATRSSNTGPGNLGLYVSVDGFALSLFTFVQSGTNFTNSIVDLSSLTGLTGNIEFRIIEIGSTSAAGGVTASTGTFRIAEYLPSGGGSSLDVSFNGTVNAVPEPTSALLAGICGFGLLFRRRR